MDVDEDEYCAALAFIAAANPATVLTLLAEIEGLHAQHARDSGELRKLCSARDSARRQRDQLKAESETLRKDSERYRAIRDDIPHLDFGRAILDVQTAAEYDSAVDATMTKEASHG
ncbi:hypothetical protein D3C78_1588740 [compost metagenome]